MVRVIVLVCLLGLSVVAHAAAAKRLPVTIEPIKVGPHTYYVQGFSGAASAENQGYMSNAGFVVTDAGVLVFDSLGTPALAEKLVAAIAKITTQPIKRVIVSHYHADHIYGLQVFKALGAEIWAHAAGREYIGSDEARLRLQQRREILKPWVDEKTRVLPADRWLAEDTDFAMGGLHFNLRYAGPAHSDEDLVLFVQEDQVLYSGDILFKGRVPFVGTADSRLWLQALEKLMAFKPKFMVPGHGAVSTSPAEDLALTRNYLVYLRQVMSDAVKNFVPFDEAYAQTDWSQYSKLPAFVEANRANAYNTYLLMEKEMLAK